MRIFILITIFILSPTLWWNTLHPEKIDLVELQKQEKQRREKTKKSILCVTNDTLSTIKANNNYTVTIIKPNKTNNWGNLYQDFSVQGEKETSKPSAPGEDRKDISEITFYNEPYGGSSTSGYFVTPRAYALTYQINEARRVISKLEGEIRENEEILKRVQQQQAMYPPVQEQQEKLYQGRINNLEDAIEAQQDKITALEKELREEYERRNLSFPGDYPERDGSNPGAHRTAPVDQNQTPINNGNNNKSGNTNQGGSVPGGSSSHLSPGGSKSNFDVKHHKNNVNIRTPQPQFRIQRKR